MREKLTQELEEERGLRRECERRLQQVTQDTQPTHTQTQMTSLQQHFSRMEDTVRSLLQNQGVLETSAMDTVDIMKVYKDQLSKEVEKLQSAEEKRTSRKEEPHAKMSQSGTDEGREAESTAKASQSQTMVERGDEHIVDPEGTGEEMKDDTQNLLERLKALQEENSALATENENQREQYERCLDEVANQVVQALLTQKDLREECLKLRTRVFDLEQQNRTLSVLFQQKLRPASDLLLQKLYSRLMDLSSVDLQLDPERTKNLLMSRTTESPPHELLGKGFLLSKCSSQLSLTAASASVHVHAHPFGRSSCSSSELSLSSACSDFSSGSHTWNDRRSSAKMSSLTWEKRCGLGSSVPGNICSPPLEDSFPSRPKECHILEGLRRLQRRSRHPKDPSSSSSSACPPRHQRSSAYKDCMNSNEGIYSLGAKSGGGVSVGVTTCTGVSKALQVGSPAMPSSAGGKRFAYDSDDADDESAQVGDAGLRLRHSIPSKDSAWFRTKKLSHSVSDSLCSWDGVPDTVIADGVPGEAPPPYSSRERPEKLLSFLNGFLVGSKRCSAPTPTTQLHYELNNMELEGSLHLSESDDPGDEPPDPGIDSSDQSNKPSGDGWGLVLGKGGVRKEPHRFSRDSDQMHQLRKEQVRAQSADSRPRPMSYVRDQKVSKAVQSEESVMSVLDADGQPIKLCETRRSASHSSANEAVTKIAPPPDYAELLVQERPSRLSNRNYCNRNYSVLDTAEKPGDLALRGTVVDRVAGGNNSREGSGERQGGSQGGHKLIKPSYNRSNKGHCAPPTMSSGGGNSKPNQAKSRGVQVKGPPLKGPNSEGALATQETAPSSPSSPSSPPIKLSRFLKTAGGGGGPKASPLAGSKSGSRSGGGSGSGEWGRSSSSSPRLTRRHLTQADYSQQAPTRDRPLQEKTAKSDPRSPSPPPPPGRTTSLLIRPNYQGGSTQTSKVGLPASPATPSRGPPPSYQPPPVPAPPQKELDTLEVDAGYCTVTPNKMADSSKHHQQAQSSSNHTPSRGLPRRVHAKLQMSSSSPGRLPDKPDDVTSPAGPRTPQKGTAPPPPSNLPQKGASTQTSGGACKAHPSNDTRTTSCKTAGGDTQTHNLSGKGGAPRESGQGDYMDPRSPPQAVPAPQLGANAAPAESSGKTRIPIGLRAFVKSPLKKSSTIPGKQEKDHINTVSKETASSEGLSHSANAPPPPPYHLHLPPVRGTTDPKPQALPLLHHHPPPIPQSVEESTQTTPPGEERGLLGADKMSTGDKMEDQDLKRTVSISSKSHMKPALGMTGAKARSQSFSTHYLEKPTINGSTEGHAKVRTQIITSTAEKRASLSRQSSCGEAATTKGAHESLSSSSSFPVSSAGDSIIASSSHPGLVEKTTVEVRSLPLSDRPVVKSARHPAKVASHPQFDSTCYQEGAQSSQGVPPPGQPSANHQEGGERLANSVAAVCSIEEKVMMGIVENVEKTRRSQGIERSNSGDAKPKPVSSLASWFGFRKNKTPATTATPNAKKTTTPAETPPKSKTGTPDNPKSKETKKESKMGGVLGGRQAKKGKKKQDPCTPTQGAPQDTSTTDNSNKMAAMSPSSMGKEQLVKELLNRTTPLIKEDSHTTSLVGLPFAKRSGDGKTEMDVHCDTTILVNQKLGLHTDREDENAETVCQDNMIGSFRQTRTLDSGIGTFPLPDGGTRQAPRAPPKPLDPSNPYPIVMGTTPQVRVSRKEEKDMATPPSTPASPSCYPTILCSSAKVPLPVPTPQERSAPSNCLMPPPPPPPEPPTHHPAPPPPVPSNRLVPPPPPACDHPASPPQASKGCLIPPPPPPPPRTRTSTMTSLLRPPTDLKTKRFSQIELPTKRTDIPVIEFPSKRSDVPVVEFSSKPCDVPGSSNIPLDKRRIKKDSQLQQDRVLHVCTYSGSSSDGEGDPVGVGADQGKSDAPMTTLSTQHNKTHNISNSQATPQNPVKRRSFFGAGSVVKSGRPVSGGAILCPTGPSSALATGPTGPMSTGFTGASSSATGPAGLRPSNNSTKTGSALATGATGTTGGAGAGSTGTPTCSPGPAATAGGSSCEASTGSSGIPGVPSKGGFIRRRGGGLPRPHSHHLVSTHRPLQDNTSNSSPSAHANHRVSLQDRVRALGGAPQGFSRASLDSMSCLGGAGLGAPQRLRASVCGGGPMGVKVESQHSIASPLTDDRVVPRSDSILYDNFRCPNQGSSVA